MSAGTLLTVIALVLAVLTLFPTVDIRLLAVSVVLVCVALLIGVGTLDLHG